MTSKHARASSHPLDALVAVATTTPPTTLDSETPSVHARSQSHNDSSTSPTTALSTHQQDEDLPLGQPGETSLLRRYHTLSSSSGSRLARLEKQSALAGMKEKDRVFYGGMSTSGMNGFSGAMEEDEEEQNEHISVRLQPPSTSGFQLLRAYKGGDEHSNVSCSQVQIEEIKDQPLYAQATVQRNLSHPSRLQNSNSQLTLTVKAPTSPTSPTTSTGHNRSWGPSTGRTSLVKTESLRRRMANASEGAADRSDNWRRTVAEEHEEDESMTQGDEPLDSLSTSVPSMSPMNAGSIPSLHRATSERVSSGGHSRSQSHSDASEAIRRHTSLKSDGRWGSSPRTASDMSDNNTPTLVNTNPSDHSRTVTPLKSPVGPFPGSPWSPTAEEAARLREQGYRVGGGGQHHEGGGGGGGGSMDSGPDFGQLQTAFARLDAAQSVSTAQPGLTPEVDTHRIGVVNESGSPMSDTASATSTMRAGPTSGGSGRVTLPPLVTNFNRPGGIGGPASGGIGTKPPSFFSGPSVGQPLPSIYTGPASAAAYVPPIGHSAQRNNDVFAMSKPEGFQVRNQTAAPGFGASLWKSQKDFIMGISPLSPVENSNNASTNMQWNMANQAQVGPLQSPISAGSNNSTLPFAAQNQQQHIHQMLNQQLQQLQMLQQQQQVLAQQQAQLLGGANTGTAGMSPFGHVGANGGPQIQPLHPGFRVNTNNGRGGMPSPYGMPNLINSRGVGALSNPTGNVGSPPPPQQQQQQAPFYNPMGEPNPPFVSFQPLSGPFVSPTHQTTSPPPSAGLHSHMSSTPLLPTGLTGLPHSPPPPQPSQHSQSVMSIDVESLAQSKGFNPIDFNTKPECARFFIIKSYTEEDVHKSLKYGIWASTDLGNKRLDKAFGESGGVGPVYLLYSVNGSGHFCGIAKMTTAVDYNTTSNVWAQDKWKGIFKVEWIWVKDIPNAALRHIRLNNTPENKPVTSSRDTQEVPYDKGCEMLGIFTKFQSRTTLLQDYAWYEHNETLKQNSRGQVNESSTSPTTTNEQVPSSEPTQPDVASINDYNISQLTPTMTTGHSYKRFGKSSQNNNNNTTQNANGKPTKESKESTMNTSTTNQPIRRFVAAAAAAVRG